MFLKLYSALIVIVLIALFYGMVLRPRNVQLTSNVRSEEIKSVADHSKTMPAPKLDDYFQESNQPVPEDDAMGPMGTCPPSKPFSTDLPLANIPMCMAKSQQNMKLHAL